jgi:hypothetical protein
MSYLRQQCYNPAVMWTVYGQCLTSKDLAEQDFVLDKCAKLVYLDCQSKLHCRIGNDKWYYEKSHHRLLLYSPSGCGSVTMNANPHTTKQYGPMIGNNFPGSYRAARWFFTG